MRIRGMKKIAAVLAAAMMLSLGGCGKKDQQHQTGIPKIPGMEQVLTPDTEKLPAPVADERVYAEKENPDFEAYLDEQFRDSVTTDTLSYNYTIKNAADFGIDPPAAATLGDPEVSDEAMAKYKDDLQEEYDKLLQFEDADLTWNETFTYEWMKDNLEISLAAADYQWFQDAFSPMRGLQANIPSEFTDYRFDDKKDVEDYITLLTQMDGYFAECIDYEKRRAEAGYFMTDDNADSVIEQCDSFIGTDPHENFMILVFNERVDELDFLTEEEKEAFKKQDEDAVVNHVIKAFQDLKDCMESLKGSCTTTLGALVEYEGGKEYYETLVKRFAGTDKTPEEVGAYLDDKIQSAIMEMSALYYSDPDSYQLFVDSYEDLFGDTDGMDTTEEIELIMDTAMTEYPDIGRIIFTAHHMSEAEQVVMEHTMAYYMSPAIDDQDGNLIYVNDAFQDGMWTTLAHEGCPGHMYQNAYFMKTNPHPYRTTAHELGYMEGWAVYSSYHTLRSYFAKYYGEEHADFMAGMAVLDEALGYALQGRVDVAVNYEGWTEEDVADYMNSFGFNGDMAMDIINVCTGDPAVYLSYSESYYEMEDLRAYAEEQLGDLFDPVEYHAAILEVGPCKFYQLKKVVDRYIIDKLN